MIVEIKYNNDWSFNKVRELLVIEEIPHTVTMVTKGLFEVSLTDDDALRMTEMLDAWVGVDYKVLGV